MSRAALLLIGLLGLGCTTLRAAGNAPLVRRVPASIPALAAQPLDSFDQVVVHPEATTIEDSWILRLYDRLRGDDYEAYRVELPGVDGKLAVAHLLVPRTDGPHPAVLVFPIRGGSHLVSEALAKAFVNRGYAALRLERHEVFAETDAPGDIVAPAARLRASLLDARRLVDWLARHPRIDADRLAVAGVSMGGILAATLMGVDERIGAGLFMLAGGGLPALLHDSREPSIRRFRAGALARLPDASRQAFESALRPHTKAVDPLTYAHNVDPRRALLITGRFDRVVPPDRAKALWRALGQPAWVQLPTGHYSVVPFFWWSAGQGADLFDRVLAKPLAQHASERR